MVPGRCQPIPCRSIFNILIVCFLHGMVLSLANIVSMSGFIFIQPTNIWSTCWTKWGLVARDSSCKERFTSGSPVAPKCNVILVVTSQHRLRVLWHHFSMGSLLVLGRVDLRYWWIVNKITTFGSTNPRSTHGPPTTMTTGLRALRTIRNSKVPERDGGGGTFEPWSLTHCRHEFSQLVFPPPSLL